MATLGAHRSHLLKKTKTPQVFAEKKDAFLFFIQKKVSVLQEILFSRYIDISLFVGFKEIISLCVSKTIC